MLIWRTRLGYEIRTVGANPTAAIYGGISPARITIITTLLSGALAGGLAVNVILGEEHRLILEFTGGFGFVGIAVALMGRAHPVGIVLAAILFGVLYQGGAELAFDKPKISRDMIVVIQGLVVLFAGALEHMFRRPVAMLLARRTDANRRSDGRAMEMLRRLHRQIFGSGIRLAVPLILACLAGLWSERSGVVDIGLEGKMLIGRLRRGAASRPSPAAPGWACWRASSPRVVMSLIHGYASIDQRANQIVSGTAINMVADGMTALIGNAIWSQGGRTPQLPDTALFNPIALPFAESFGAVPILGPIYRHLISGHDIVTYVAFALVPVTYWALYSTRFGLRLRAVGENPAAVDTAGISVRGLRYSAVVICGVLVGLSGVYLSIAQAAYFQPHMSAGKGFIALAALVFAKWRPWPALATCLLFGFLDALAIRLQGDGAAGDRRGAGAGDPGAALCPDRRPARRLHRQGDSAEGLGHSLCQGALNRRSRRCSRRPGPRRPTPMRPIRASRSAPRSARRRARSLPAATSRTPPIRKGPARRPARSRAMALAGERRIAEICVVGDGEALCTPCGGCRQRIREFADARTPIHIAGPEGVRATFTLGELLPESFGPGASAGVRQDAVHQASNP